MRRAVLFDLDDTIFDHQHNRRVALRALVEAYPVIPERDVRKLEALHEQHLQDTHTRLLVGRLTHMEARQERMRLFFADFGLQPSKDEVARADVIYRQAYDAARRPVPGAVALIKALKSTMRLGIITNGLVRVQEQKIRQCGVAGRFDAEIISERVGLTKPDPEIFRLALTSLGVSAVETVFIGDSWTADVLGARSAGLAAVWFNRYEAACPEPGSVVEINQLEPTDDIVRLLKGDKAG